MTTIRANKITVETLWKALYIINKEAKKYRDMQEWRWNKIEEYKDLIYFERKYSLKKYLDWLYDSLNYYKSKKENLYDIKDKAVNKIINDFKLKPIWYHSFNDWYKRDYFEVWGFWFHINANNSTNNLWHIEEIMDKEKMIKLSFKSALQIIEDYLNN